MGFFFFFSPRGAVTAVGSCQGRWGKSQGLEAFAKGTLRDLEHPSLTTTRHWILKAQLPAAR